ncbi:hypothetical protein F3Y22_tig00003041pilonHSYRG00915 [Hibiscus syriacus]|uniref:DNA helicase n=1 Tax=Hibiscus syriacus TaxID=106335 RepID=A0A6A3CSF1_HIBSY|nr:hypothetical protein F3Y22_tig00003041pilonHSYRG00915 [Hibiscus syriacus]
MLACRYDSSKTFSQNVELTNPIISRFDVLCVVKDVVDSVTDEMLAQFVVDSHFRSQPKSANMDDRASSESQEETRAYAGLADSKRGQGVPIAVRHIESMIKMSEAHARMHLRQHVTEEDVDMAIRVVLESFVST